MLGNINKKINLYIVTLIIIVFTIIIFPYEVKAWREDVCNNGFVYTINTKGDSNIDLKDFYSTGLSLSYSSNRNVNIDGVMYQKGQLIKDGINHDFYYFSSGSYINGGDSKSSNRCYVVTTSNTVGNKNTTTYTPKYCGYQYNLAYFDSKQTVDKNTGKITLTLSLKNVANNPFNNEEIFKRIKISNRVYEGTSANGKLGDVTIDSKTKTIKITNIIPSDYDKESTYYVYLYIDGIKASDFNEKDGKEAEYIKSCGGANGGFYLGAYTVAIKNAKDVKVNNPLYYDKSVLNPCPILDEINASDEMKKLMVPECYDKEIILTQKDNIRNTAIEKITKAIEIYQGISEVKGLVSEDDLLCTDTRLGLPAKGALTANAFESKITYESYGEYFGMICAENYYVDAGEPQLVQPGMGVEYKDGIQIVKNCSIVQIKKAEKPPKCKLKVSTGTCLPSTSDQSWKGGGPGAPGGPTADFDDCVNECDGGKYTQSCINSCYQSTYSDNRSNSISFSNSLETKNNYNKYASNSKINNSNITDSNFNFNEETGSFVVTGYLNGPQNIDFGGANVTVVTDPKIPSDTNSGIGAILIYVDGQLVDKHGYSQYCDNHSNPCSFGVSVGPSGCSWDPDGEYYRRLYKALLELRTYEDIARQFTQIQNYTMSFTDTVTGNIYQLSGSTTDSSNSFNEPRLQFTVDFDPNEDQDITEVDYLIGVDGDGDASDPVIDDVQKGYSHYSSTVIYNVELPTTYTKTGKTSVIAIEGNNKRDYYSYTTEVRKKDGYNYYVIKKLQDYHSIKFNAATFSEGNRVYYTNPSSGNFNVSINDGRFDAETLGKIKYAEVTVNDKITTFALVNNYENIDSVITLASYTDGTNKADSTWDTAHIDCYYGVFSIDPDYDGDDGTNPDPKPPEGGYDDGNGGSGLRYYYREIKLTDVFPNNRSPRWNWTGTITKNSDGSTITTGASNNEDPAYLVDPEKLTESIESKGDSIFTDASEVDYEYTLSIETINTIRKYNKMKLNGRKITYLDFTLENNGSNKARSNKMNDWFPNLNTTNITECNNSKDNKCDN